MARFFGTPLGANVGDFFPSRRALPEALLHRPLQAGTSGRKKNGADTIMISGGYVDDEFSDDEVFYPGHGVNAGGRQAADQSLPVSGNAALVETFNRRYPVRPIPYVDAAIPRTIAYRYEGLFWVVSYNFSAGTDGCKIERFRSTPHPVTACARFAIGTVSARPPKLVTCSLPPTP